MKARDGRDPFHLDSHRPATMDWEECEGDPVCYVDEEGNYDFIDQEELDERHCPACEFQMALYANWMHNNRDEETDEPADPYYIDLAFRAMELEQNFEMFKPSPREISAVEFEYVCVVKAVRSRIAEQKAQEREREANAVAKR